MANNLKAYLRVALVLLSISAVIALLLAVVNAATVDIIIENERAATQAAIDEIFPNASAYDELDESFSLPVTAVWRIKNNDGSFGYCIFATVQGFKAEVSYIVGTDAQGVIIGVRVTSNSETAGLGSKIAEIPYLDNYIGKSGKLTLKRDVDAVAGATISSRALLDGINSALELPIFGGRDDASETTEEGGEINDVQP